MSGSRARRSPGPPAAVQRRALRWGMVAAAIAAVVGITAVAVIQLTSDDEPALEVGAWELSRSELRSNLESVEDNAVYRTLRDQVGSPLTVREDDGGAFTTEFVAEILNERLTFRLAELALEQRSGGVTAQDRTEARAVLGGKLVGTAVIGGSREATVEKVLEDFGDYRPTLEEGLATIEALERVIEADLPPIEDTVVEDEGDESGDEVYDPADDPVEQRVAEVDSLLREALVEVAQREGVTVAADLGVYTSSTATIAPAAADADLEPMDPAVSMVDELPAPADGDGEGGDADVAPPDDFETGDTPVDGEGSSGEATTGPVDGPVTGPTVGASVADAPVGGG